VEVLACAWLLARLSSTVAAAAVLEWEGLPWFAARAFVLALLLEALLLCSGCGTCWCGLGGWRTKGPLVWATLGAVGRWKACAT
jgi:hypothetical protein